jgi:hypothetical protein
LPPFLRRRKRARTALNGRDPTVLVVHTDYFPKKKTLREEE